MTGCPLVGAWELVGYEVPDAEPGERFPLGREPLGRLIYTAAGDLAVHYMAGDRPAPATANWRFTTDAEKLAAVRAYGGYSGRYTWHGDRVSHHVEACIHPNWIGTTLVRRVELTGTDLVLRVAEPGPAPTPVLRWRRRS